MRTIRKLLVVCILCQALAAQATITGPQIAAGSVYSLFMKAGGSLWGMGGNFEGQLGLGPENQANSPALVTNGVAAVACGANHSLLIESNGSLWAMGDNQWGQLGDGTDEDTANVPEMIVPSGVAAVAGGYDHSLFLQTDGSLWAMGDDFEGELGDGGYPSVVTVPEQIAPSGVIAIAAGQNFSFFIKSDYSLWAMGENFNGQLGDGTIGGETNQPEEIVPSGVVAVAAGYSHSIFLKSDGSLWVMGDNCQGELGDGTTNQALFPEQILSSGVVAIAAGQEFSLFVKSDGSLWGMGVNSYGQLGTGPTQGNGAPLYTNVPVEIVSNGVIAVAAGAFHSIFQKSDGSIWTMGNNSSGQLGDGFDVSQSSAFSPVPEQIFPAPPPHLTAATVLGTNLRIQATCLFGDSYCLLSSTNLALPFPQWTPLVTNAVYSRGTNNFSPPFSDVLTRVPHFYILRSE